MAGVAALLLTAAIGVTYGWQPDSDGGVEYIIQVPPDRLQQFQDAGEISSVIDPEVRGQVSRVVIKIGTGTVPREMPRSLQSGTNDVVTNSRFAETQSWQPYGSAVSGNPTIIASDCTPIPIPEIRSVYVAQPLGMAATGSVVQVSDASPHVGPKQESAPESLMKPDANGTGGGFSLPPSLQEGASRAAATVQEGANRAAQQFAEQARNEMDATLGNLGQATQRTASEMAERAGNTLREGVDAAAANLPGFSNSGDVGFNSGQRTLTQPNLSPTNAMSQQDRPTGSNLNNQVPAFTGIDPTGAMASTRSGAPTTDPTSNRDNSWYDLQNAPARTAGPSTDPIARSASETRSASQFQDPRASATTSPALGTTATFGRVPDGLAQSQQNNFAGNTSAAGNAASTSAQNQASDSLQRQQAEYQRQLREQQLREQQLRQQQYEQQQAALANQSNASSTTFGNSFDSGSSTSYSPGLVDSRLSAADVAGLPPGAWGYNAYGEPIDRQGRVLDRFGRIVTNPDTVRATGSIDPRYAQSNSTYAAQQSPVTSNQTDNASSASQYAPAQRTTTAAQEFASPSDRSASLTQQSRESLSDRDTEATATTARTQVAPPTNKLNQPLVNSLLLVSIAVNVYLVVWLKNLRLQFRDLVAAKRMSQSTKSSPA